MPRRRRETGATWASGQGWGRAGVGRLVEPDVGPRRRRVRRPKPAAARPDWVVDELRPRANRDDLQSEGLASRVVPSSRRGSRAGRYRRSRFPTSGAARESATTSFSRIASLEAADRGVGMRGGLHRASHGARPLRPALQPASARVSGRRVFNFSKIPSITLLLPANNASGPPACTLLNGAS